MANFNVSNRNIVYSVNGDAIMILIVQIARMKLTATILVLIINFGAITGFVYANIGDVTDMRIATTDLMKNYQRVLHYRVRLESYDVLITNVYRKLMFVMALIIAVTVPMKIRSHVRLLVHVCRISLSAKTAIVSIISICAII